MEYRIRFAAPGDLEAVARVERDCFPAAEAAGKEELSDRLAAFPDSFLVAETSGQVIGFINGCVTDEAVIRDEMYADCGLHRPDGAYQAVFGLDVAQAYREKGVAAQLMRSMVEQASKQGRRGVILTCKERLIHYYEGFGFRNMGVSDSNHGGAVWHDMLLLLDDLC